MSTVTLEAVGWAPSGKYGTWHLFKPGGKSFCGYHETPAVPLQTRPRACAALVCKRCRGDALRERVPFTYRRPMNGPRRKPGKPISSGGHNPTPGLSLTPISDVELVGVICRAFKWRHMVDGVVVVEAYSNDFRRQCIAELRARRIVQAQLERAQQKERRQYHIRSKEGSDDDGSD